MIALDPRFVAERPSPLDGVLAALARRATDDDAPTWLLDFQRSPFRRGLEAVRTHGGVMLALPVGTGKSYLALAIADRVRDDESIAVVAPAVLRGQWARVADAVRLPIHFVSHDAVSRGATPAGRGPVIIDESHRFRTATTRRYRTLAPALVSRAVILATATPIVNRPSDLFHQLLLAVPDDALSGEGIESLRAAGDSERLATALEAVVIRAEAPLGQVPSLAASSLSARPDPRLGSIIGELERLRLSKDPAIRRLIRISLLRAIGSSPDAARAAIDRYRRLLEHARRAARAGHRLDRRRIAALVRDEPDQLLLWEVLPHETSDPTELALADGPALDRLVRHLDAWRGSADVKLGQLEALLAERPVTVVFTTFVETARYLRQRLAVGGVVWVTGSRAGQGPMRLSRAAALGAFDDAVPWIGVGRPWLLIATDVAAEGLNLNRVERVVHYDLPWTAVRLTQRAGRATRLHSAHQTIEEIRFELPPPLEAALALEATLARKARLPGRLGFGAGPTPAIALLEAWSAGPPVFGWAAVGSGFAVAAVTDGTRSELWVEVAEGAWTTEPGAVARALASLATARPRLRPRKDLVDRAREGLAKALRFAEHHRTVGPLVVGRRPNGIRAVMARAGRYARARQWADVGLADRAVAFLRRGHRAGDRTIALAVAADHASPPPEATRDRATSSPRLLALVVVDPDPPSV